MEKFAEVVEPRNDHPINTGSLKPSRHEFVTAPVGNKRTDHQRCLQRLFNFVSM